MFFPTSTVEIKSDMPHLIEHFAKTHILHNLQSCHETRNRIYSYVFNILCLVVLLFLGGSSLYLCRKQKASPFEQQEKLKRDQQLVLSKIRQFQIDKMRQHESLAHLPENTYTPAVMQNPF